MIHKILTYPSKKLRDKSKPVNVTTIQTQSLQQLAKDMAETMKVKDGVGLAAPQIGKHVRLIAVLEKNGPIVLFNPEIIKASWRKEIDEEGCLSVPGVYGTVKRNYKVVVTGILPDGSEVVIEAKGLLARVFQHEIDHLDGILFIDKVIKLTKKTL